MANVTEPTCTVTMDEVTTSSTNFVCVLANEEGHTALFYNTDALTLGIAMKQITRCWVEAMHGLPEDERNTVAEILSADFSEEGEEDNEED